jgi:hypothetical protein
MQLWNANARQWQQFTPTHAPAGKAQPPPRSSLDPHQLWAFMGETLYSLVPAAAPAGVGPSEGLFLLVPHHVSAWATAAPMLVHLEVRRPRCVVLPPSADVCLPASQPHEIPVRL